MSQLFKYFTLGLLFISLGLASIPAHKIVAQDDGTPNCETYAEEISDLYYMDFQNHIAAQDVEQMRDLYWYPDIPFYAVRKGEYGPTLGLGSTDGWHSFISLAINYEMQFDEPNIIIIGNSAILIANYDEYTNRRHLAHGTDVFTYIKTEDDWKLSTINLTYIPANDHYDYSNAYAFDQTIEQILESFINMLNTRNEEAFLDVFKSPRVQIVFTSGNFAEAFSSDIHTAVAIREQFSEIDTPSPLSLQNIQIDVLDQYLAVAIADYSRLHDDQLEIGKMVFTLVATRSGGWQITSAIATEQTETQDCV